MPRLDRRMHGLLLLAALLAGACRLERTPPPTETLPEPPVPVGLGPDGGINRNRVIEAGRAGRYDQNPGSSHRAVLDGVADLTLEPLEGAYRTPKDAFDKGVVVARLVNNGDSALARLGIQPRSTTFWFIYRKDGTLFSAFIPDVPTDKFDVIGVRTIGHPPTRPWRQSVSQWQLPGVLGEKVGMGALGTVAYSGSMPWVTCTTDLCCKPEPPLR